MKHVNTLLFGAQLALGAAAAAPNAAWIRLKSPLGVSEIKVGQLIFTNRPYTFKAFPEELTGLRFVHGDIEATFDVEVVQHAIEENPEAGWPRFIQYIVEKRDENTLNALQEFLQRFRLSSFARIVLRRT